MKLILLLLLALNQITALGAPFELVVKTPPDSIEGEHLKERSVPLNRLTTVGASDNDVLYFTGKHWKPAPLTGLSFQGTWNPVDNDNPSIDVNQGNYDRGGSSISAITGDYFIVTESLPDGSWNKGDWIVFNGETWERINNTGVILSIFGRKNNVMPRSGDYSWEMIDKQDSSIFDLSNVSGSTSDLINHEGEILKWDQETQSWVLSPDEKGSIVGFATSEDILDGEVSNADISDGALISANKINGLDEDLDKLSKYGGSIENLNINNNALITGENGRAILLRQDKSTTEIIFSSLKELFDGVVGTYFSLEPNITGSGVETQYLSEKRNSDGLRTWSEFNLDIANEGEVHQFQTDENVWGAVLNNYKQVSPEEISGDDTILSAIEKLEAQLNQTNVNVSTSTSMIDDGSIDPLVHFSNPEGNGFLKLSGVDPKSWGLEMTSGVQFKGEISFDELSSLPSQAVSGDYYVLTNSGDYNGMQWNEGDWAIFDGASYLQINNSGKVLSFNSRTGVIEPCPGSPSCAQGAYDYDWSMIDKSSSALSDLSDIPEPVEFFDDNKVLKRIGGQWSLEDESIGVNQGEAVPLSSIADGAIADSHLSDISIDQVAGNELGTTLEDELSGLLEKTGGVVEGNINLDGHDLLGVSTINHSNGVIFNMSEAIDFAMNKDSKLESKQDLLPAGGNGSQILVSKNGGVEFTSLTTDNVQEGSSNLYFSEQRVREALGFPTGPNPNHTTNDIVYGGDNPDTLQVAIEKLYGKIESAQTPDGNTLSAASLQENSLSIDAFYPADEAGQTMMYFNGEWRYRSIAGLSLKGSIDLSTGSAPSANGLQDGDYYIVTGAGKIDGVDFEINDWAVYSNDANGFNRLSKKQGIQSFNGRVGDISPEANDYSWEMINNEDAPLSAFSNEIASYSALAAVDAGKVLKFNGLKWEASADNQGLDPAGLTLSNFSSGATKSISNSDIASVDFTHINGLEEEFDSKFVDLTNDPVIFHGQLNFNQNHTETIVNQQGSSQTVPVRFSLVDVGNVIDSTNNILFSFSDLANQCGSLNSSQFENFTGEGLSSDNKRLVLNANKEFVELKPEYLTGDVAGALFDPGRVRDLVLSDFVMETLDLVLKVHDPMAAGFDASDPTSNGFGTSLSNVFNKLAGKVYAYVNQVHPGLVEAGADVLEGEFLEIDGSYNGKMIAVEDANVKILDSVEEGFEVTIKRVDPVGINPNTISIDVRLESGQIEGKNKFILQENFASITLKLIKESDESNPEFVVLRRSGAVN